MNSPWPLNPEFVDYYESLEASPNASSATLEQVFRYLANKYHPDSSESGDAKRFSILVEAYETLSNPAARAAYDITYDQNKNQHNAPSQDTGLLSSDTADRERAIGPVLYSTAAEHEDSRHRWRLVGKSGGAFRRSSEFPPVVLSAKGLDHARRRWPDGDHC